MVVTRLALFGVTLFSVCDVVLGDSILPYFPDAIVCEVVKQDGANTRTVRKVFYVDSMGKLDQSLPSTIHYYTVWREGASTAAVLWHIAFLEDRQLVGITLPPGWRSSNCEKGQTVDELRRRGQAFDLRN